MVPDETSDLPTTLPEASFLNPNRKVPSEARSLRGLFPVPVFAEFPSYSLSKNADGFLQNPFWLSYCNLRKLKLVRFGHFLYFCIKTGYMAKIKLLSLFLISEHTFFFFRYNHSIFYLKIFNISQTLFRLPG